MKRFILAILATLTIIFSLFVPSASASVAANQSATGTIVGNIDPIKHFLSVNCAQLATPQRAPGGGIWLSYSLRGNPNQTVYIEPASYVANGDGTDVLKTSTWDKKITLDTNGFITHGTLFFRVPKNLGKGRPDFYEVALLIRTEKHKNRKNSDADDSCGVFQVVR